MAEKFYAFEELLRNGGNIAPRFKFLRSDLMCKAKFPVSRDMSELPREKFSREFIPLCFIDPAQQLARPCAANGGLGEGEAVIPSGGESLHMFEHRVNPSRSRGTWPS